MFRDNTLLPKEAIRLAALGLLSKAPMRYADLANTVRDFTTHFWGPTLDVMGSSIELMRLEGLIESDGEADASGDSRLRLSDAGRDELRELLTAAVRAPGGDFDTLVVALKLRFLHLLPAAEQREQVEALIETRESELARLAALRAAHAGEDSHFVAWLDHRIGGAEADLAWLNGLRGRLGAS